MRYYHVVGEGYCPGEDLLSYDELCRQGRPPKWKWDRVHAETNVVALSLDFAHARTFRSNHGGTILVVDLPSDFEREHVRLNSEKFQSVRDRIPAKFITGVSDDGGFPMPAEECL
jgi:hypothetical protein